MVKVRVLTLAIGLCVAVIGCKDRAQEQALRKLQSDHEMLADSTQAKEAELLALQEKFEAAEKQRKKEFDDPA